MTVENTSTFSTEPKIYVACLEAYNAGHLHGVWIKANQLIEDIQAAIEEMLANSPINSAEEWEIHDSDNFGCIKVGGYGLETIIEMAEIIEEHGELGTALIDYHDGCTEYAKNALNDDYCGQYDSDEDFARQCVEERGDMPSDMKFYIDYKYYARDLLTEYYSIDVEGCCHVFYA